MKSRAWLNMIRANFPQSMATGLDEDFKRPKNLTDQLVRLLDDDAVPMADRIRLVLQYILHRDGVFNADIEKLLAHAQLPPQDGEMIHKLDLLGARVVRHVREQRHPVQPLFPPRPVTQAIPEELSLSRFEPTVKMMLEEQLRGTLDQHLFPYTKPLLDGDDAVIGQVNVSQSSLRSAKPTWARTRPSAMEPRQRVIVFMAGGATYSESRACYKVSRAFSKDVYMATSHMLTPGLFLRQLGDLSVDRQYLNLPADQPKQRAPAHVFERNARPSQPASQPHHRSSTSTANPIMPNGGRTSNRNGNTIEHGPKSHPLPSPEATTSAPSHKYHKDPKEKIKGLFRF